MKINRIIGSLLGFALGDALGAPYEGGIIERALWAFIGIRNGKLRWTDDTQMSIDVIESLIEHKCINQDDLARRFAQSYRWSRGYGPGTAKILKRIRRGQPWESVNCSVYSNGSFGNGGAMRDPVVGLFFANNSEKKLIKATCDATVLTHTHPLALEGAALIALATALAYNDASPLSIIESLCQHANLPEFLIKLHKTRTWLKEERLVTPKMLIAELGNATAAVESCVTAIYIALIFNDRYFSKLLDFSIKLRGDVDTISAMACAIWGAAHGLNALPHVQLERLEQYEHLKTLTQSFASQVMQRNLRNGKNSGIPHE